MSAFIVSGFHINTLINWAAQNRVSVYWGGRPEYVSENPEGYAGALYATNVESVNTRYKEDRPLEGFMFRAFHTTASAVQILKACGCYDYQACEVADYDKTFAHATVNAIRHRAITLLPGYEDAAWELREV